MFDEVVVIMKLNDGVPDNGHVSVICACYVDVTSYRRCLSKFVSVFSRTNGLADSTPKSSHQTRLNNDDFLSAFFSWNFVLLSIKLSRFSWSTSF